MANKIQFYAEIAEETAHRITENQQQWTAFLRTAARMYKYPYHDQLMIFAQRPDATACAEYDLWNRVMRRYVRRGSKGIALLDASGDQPGLRYVFDVADTGTRQNSRPVQPWSMKEEYRKPVQRALARAFEVPNSERTTLESQLYAAADRLVDDYWEQYSQQILDILEGSYLMGYDQEETAAAFHDAVTNSTAYCLYCRCTENPDEYFEPEDVLHVFEFNTRQATSALGTAVSSLSERIFREIERAIRQYEREKAAEQVIIQTQDQYPEGSERDEDRDNVYTERRLSDPGSSGDGGRDEGDRTRQIRQDAQGLSAGEQPDADERPDPDRETVSAPGGDPADSERADRADPDTAASEASGSGQKTGADGLDTAYEQPESAGGGNRDRGTDHQLSVAGLIPSESEQIRIIETIPDMAESEKPSAFFITDEEAKRVLQNGSGYFNGKMRIQTLYSREADPKRRADYLKNEYGTGGRSWTFSDNTRGYVDFSSRGMLIRSYSHDTERRIRWTEAEQLIADLFQNGQYLSEPEQQEFERLRQEYAGYGEIPLPDPVHAFLPVEELVEQSADLEVDESDVDAEHGSEEADKNLELFNADDALEESVPVTLEEIQSEESLLKAEETVLEPGAEKETVEVGNDFVGEDAKHQEPEIPAVNFRITDEHLGEGGAKEKFRRNIAAIETLLTLEAENRNASAEEQEILSQYVGWGGLADAFDPDKENWAKEYAQLKELLSGQEYDMARASTLNAHYTSPVVIRAMYEAIEKMGFQTGNILEPSMGIGNFFGMLPEEMQGSRLYGVELDSITGRIARKLYPDAEITVAGFETTDRRDFFDLAVGNVPFGNYRVHDRPYDRLGFSIHNYFFAKALDQVRPGGIVAFVTSRYTMDQQSPEVRRYLAQRAELLGAIRLPENAFRANAGTDVVSDILFFQKREHLMDREEDWIHLGRTAEGFAVNQYFVDHPEMVLGKLSKTSTQYGRQDYTVLPLQDQTLSEQLREAISHIQGRYMPQFSEEQAFEADVNVLPADPGVRNFSYTVVSGEVYFRENAVMRPVDLNEKMKGRIKGLVTLRQIVGELIDAQLNDDPEEEIVRKQQELNAVYDTFTAEYGLINSRSNARAFEEDSSYYLLCSLENLNEDGELESKADMFTKRTIRPERKVTHVDTPSEALAVSIGERGSVDLPYMTQLLGTPGEYEEILTALQGVIFKDPLAEPGMEQGWQTADEYLSGPVREKLRQARAAAKQDPSFRINVEALEKAQPKDLEASEIDVRLGATWLDPRIIQQFMQETFEIPYYLQRSISVKYSPYTAEWRIEGKNRSTYNDVASHVTYGTDRANAYKILEKTLNLKDIRIYDTLEDAEGKKKRVLNKRETTLAQQKQQAIKDAFSEWIWKDPDRREQLVRQYNELFNATRPREYDGSHIRFVGMNPAITLRKHQLGAIAHVLYGGNTLLAHEVGAGKTFEMAASAMESKRLGLSQKALFVVPNHLTLQWANEFLMLYPSARLLVAGKKDFETKNRKKFCARIATGDYDAIIIGHSQFEKIPISAERQERMLREQIEEITDAIRELKNSDGENFSIKQMEKTRKSLQARLEKLLNEEKKDDVITFEQLGVDRLYVDESHAFKNRAKRCA